MQLQYGHITEEEKWLIKARVDETLKGLYRFEGVWDMEPCGIPVANKEIRWDVRFNCDAEWSYMFTRMNYLYLFILATEITKEKKYFQHGLKIIDKWFKDNRKYLGKGTGKICEFLFKKNKLGHRTIDVSIMASNIVDYVIYGVKSGWLKQSAYSHYERIVNHVIEYVMRHSNGDFKAFSNWGIQENGNVVYCLLRMKSNKYYQEVSLRLIRQIQNQILSDGSHIESSPMYLVEILFILLRILNIPHCALRDQLARPTLQGIKYIRDIRTLQNCIPNLGDSDRTNISDLMIIAAHVFQQEDFIAFADRSLDLEYCLRYGVERVPSRKRNDKRNSELIRHLHQVVYKSEADGFYILCSNTPRRIDGHKHYDYMSVLYSEFGKDVLIDMGRFSYKNDTDRQFFVGPSAHNTINISDNSFYEYVTNFVTRQRVDCCENRIVQGDGWLSIKMSCIFGYDEVVISRYVTYMNSMGLFVTDIIQNKTEMSYQYETFFNVGRDFMVEKDKELCLHDDAGNNLYYNNDLCVPVEVIPVQGSFRYNEKFPTSQLYLKSSECKVTHSFLKKASGVKVIYTETDIEYSIPDENIHVLVPVNEKNI